jgi:hypothetical protein
MAEGFDGIVDFTGLSVAQPENALVPGDSVGFVGFVDFTGIPVALPPPRVGGGIAVAGRRVNVLAAAIIESENRRSVEERMHREAIRQLASRVLIRKLEYDAEKYEQGQVFARNVNAVLLSEI